MAFDEVLALGPGPELSRQERWRVLQRVGDDVVVLAAGVDDLPAIAEHARLAMVRRADGGVETAGDERAAQDVDEGERIFVDAWRSRPLAKPDRRGEGLSWDAEGFEPP